MILAKTRLNRFNFITHMFSDEALPSLNASVSIFCVGLSVSMLKRNLTLQLLPEEYLRLYSLLNALV